MRKMFCAVAVLGLAGLSGAAVAQTRSTMLGGEKADFVLTPPRARVDGMGKAVVGLSKPDVVERVSRAAPVTLVGPAVIASPERRKP